MRDNDKYKSMVSAFRMSELQSLMSFAGKSKAGKKSDLQVIIILCNQQSTILLTPSNQREIFSEVSPLFINVVSRRNCTLSLLFSKIILFS